MKRATIACLLVALFALAYATDTAPVADVEKDDALTNVPADDGKAVTVDLDDSQDIDEDVATEDPVDQKDAGSDPKGSLDAKLSKNAKAEPPTEEESEELDVQEDAQEDDDSTETMLAVDEEEEDVESRRHASETDSIRKVLNKIKAKLTRELRSSRRHVSRVTHRENARVARALKQYKKREAARRSASNSRNRALGSLHAARRLRRRNIQRAKVSQHRDVLRRERELILIHMIECRLLELNGSIPAARKCHRHANRRAHNYHAKLSIAGNNARVYSGYCRSHSRGNGWARYCTNGHEFNQAGHFLKVRSNGVFTARKSGFFRLHFRTIQYTRNWAQHDVRTLVDGRQIDYSHMQHAHSWVENENDLVWYIRAGQNFYFQALVRGSNPYRWHSGNARGAHSRVQVSYLGQRKPVYSAYCSRHAGRGWNRYCTNRVERNNGHYFQNKGNGVRVKRTGFYRINARAIQYTRGWGSQHSRVHVGGRQVSYTHDYGVYWERHKSDLLWPIKAGQSVSVDYYVNTRGYSYHSGNSAGAHSRLQLTYEGPSNKPVVSYGCSHHDRHRNSWRTYCLNKREFNTAGRFLRVSGSGTITVLRSGTYRINAWALQHSGGYQNRHQRVLINGKYRNYTYTHHRSWRRTGGDMMWRLKRGQTVHIQYYTSGNYNYHNGMTHSRVQVSYEGSY
jgi:hypothetical protein